MPVNIRYVGHQPQKSSSRVSERFNTVWVGHGDVKEVSDEEAAALLKPQYSRIWQRAKDTLKPVEAPTAPADGAQVAEIPELDVPPAEPQAATTEQTDEDAEEAKAAAAADTEVALSDKEVTPELIRARLTEILQVIPKLTVKDFDAQGRPKLTALRALLKREVTRQERDAAWEIATSKVQAAQAPAAGAEEPETAPE